ncbi:MAG TPA: hypothetical protein RMH99_31000 [Sandaracinaceae bacterium LLY-WYZ-13_1]|nr:hypothetical protein [Sandaracinaceae bacterium LLY-WYZ-13_1]
MPLPPLLIFAVVAGMAASLAGRQELRMSPRPIPLTRSFLAYVSYACLVVVPASVYFYVFHGDWFLLYVVDVQRVPSAVALVGFVLQAGLGAIGFLFGAVLVRAQREAIAGVLIGILAVGAAAVIVVYADRLAQVGSHAQFHGQFGLEAYEAGPLMTGGLAIGGFLLGGLAFLLVRLWMSGRRA